MCTLHAVIMLCFWHQHLVSRSGVQQVCTLDLLNYLLTKLWMETYDGPTWRLISTLSSLGNRSMRIQDLYVGLFPSLLEMLPTHAHTHTHARTRPHAYARALTLAARPSRQSILGGIVPADFVQCETSGDAHHSEAR